MITDIRYNAVMVEDLEEGVQLWKDLFGLEELSQARENQFGIKAQMLGHNGQPIIEIMTPAGPETALARMMDERKNERNAKGEGMYMICLEVDDIKATIENIEAKGGKIQREEGNDNVAWVHPLGSKMVFIELQQRGAGSMGAAGGS